MDDSTASNNRLVIYADTDDNQSEADAATTPRLLGQMAAIGDEEGLLGLMAERGDEEGQATMRPRRRAAEAATTAMREFLAPKIRKTRPASAASTHSQQQQQMNSAGGGGGDEGDDCAIGGGDHHQRNVPPPPAMDGADAASDRRQPKQQETGAGAYQHHQQKQRSQQVSPTPSASSSHSARQKQHFLRQQRESMGRLYATGADGAYGKVRKNPKNGKYEVSKILAMTIYNCDGLTRRLFYVDWLGFTGQASWLRSENMDAQEITVDFGVDSTISAIFAAIKGESVPKEIAQKLANNNDFLDLMRTLNRDHNMRIEQIIFAEGLNAADKKKAAEKLRQFIQKEKIAMDL